MIINSRYCRVTLKAPLIVEKAEPGHFVMFYMPRHKGFLLPRPFSIYSLDRDREELTLFFEIKGRGTKDLAAALSEKFQCRLLGPLGKGFPPPPSGSIFLAGGLGIAPLVFLASSTEVPRTLIYAVKTAGQLACPAEDLNMPGLSVHFVTEDGSRGHKGSAIDFLYYHIAEAAALYACGPKQMLTKAAEIGFKAGVETWISLEERMACGIGACLGCVAGTSKGYRRVCCDGPVFPAGEVDFDA